MFLTFIHKYDIIKFSIYAIKNLSTREVKGMKTIRIFAVFVVAIMLTGCGTVLQTAVVATDMAIKTYDIAKPLPSQESSQDVVIDEPIETYVVADYIIMIFNGRLKKNPAIFFVARKGGDSSQAGNIAFEKNNPNDMKMINDFNRMDEAGKKRFIKEQFLKLAKIDLGPIEPEATEKTSAPAPSSPLNIPVPGFAPNPNPLPR